jgi:hypothetical protein
MDLPYITLHTKDKGLLAWQNGYTDVKTSELETFLKIGKEMVRSLEAEIEARQMVSELELSSASSECAEKLRKCASQIRILERLDKREAKLVASAVNVLKVEQSSRDGQVYQTLLHDIYHQCSPSLVVLSAASLGKQRIVSLNARDRVKLLHYLKSNREVLTSHALESLVRKHQIPSLPGTAGLTTSMHKRS